MALLNYHNKPTCSFRIDIPDPNYGAGKKMWEEFGKDAADEILDGGEISAAEAFIQAKKVLSIITGFISGLNEFAQDELRERLPEKIFLGAKLTDGFNVRYDYKTGHPDYAEFVKDCNEPVKEVQEYMKGLAKRHEKHARLGEPMPESSKDFVNEESGFVLTITEKNIPPVSGGKIVKVSI